MPDAWSEKDERQYRKIRQSEIRRGKSASQAKEIAARTVNRQRHDEGRTPNTATQGTGNPNSSLESRSKQQLYNRAQQLDISGRSSMNKAALIAAIRGS